MTIETLATRYFELMTLKLKYNNNNDTYLLSLKNYKNKKFACMIFPKNYLNFTVPDEKCDFLKYLIKKGDITIHDESTETNIRNWVVAKFDLRTQYFSLKTLEIALEFVKNVEKKIIENIIPFSGVLYVESIIDNPQIKCEYTADNLKLKISDKFNFNISNDELMKMTLPFMFSVNQFIRLLINNTCILHFKFLNTTDTTETQTTFDNANKCVCTIEFFVNGKDNGVFNFNLGSHILIY